MKKMWTKKDDAYLKRHWQEMSDQELAEKLGWRISTIEIHRRKLGLTKNRTWTEEEMAVVRANYLYMRAKDVAALLGWSKNDIQVTCWANRMGLTRGRKSMKWMAEHDEEIRAMVEKHMKDEAIAVELGVSRDLVKKYRQKEICYLRRHGSESIVEQYTLEGVKIVEYRNPTEAGRTMGASNGANIKSCIYGKTKTAYGFIWRYKS